MSNIEINISFVKSWSGIFKILQLVVGTICVGLIGNEFNYPIVILSTSFSFFFIVICTFYIGSFILFISYLISPSAASVVPKTIYEFLYHSVASILLLAGSIAMLVQIHSRTAIILHYNELLAASICCLINTLFYIFSAVVGFSTYRDD